MLTLDENLGAQVKAARKERKLTMTELALKVRPGATMTHSKISRLERGKMTCTVFDLLILLEAMEMDRAVLTTDALPVSSIDEG